MSDIIIYDPLSNRVKNYFASQDGTPFLGQSNALIFEDNTLQTVTQLRTLLNSVPLFYLKKTGNPQVSEMTQNEKFSVDEEIRYLDRKSSQSGSKNILSNDLIVAALIQVIAEENSKTFAEIKDRIEAIIAEKLKLPK